jgi:hypothetical protein
MSKPGQPMFEALESRQMMSKSFDYWVNFPDREPNNTIRAAAAQAVSIGVNQLGRAVGSAEAGGRDIIAVKAAANEILAFASIMATKESWIVTDASGHVLARSQGGAPSHYTSVTKGQTVFLQINGRAHSAQKYQVGIYSTPPTYK